MTREVKPILPPQRRRTSAIRDWPQLWNRHAQEALLTLQMTGERLQLPSNTFKLSLSKAELQIGLWLACGDPYTASLVGQASFDCLLIDAEHGPNDLRFILAQLQVLEASPPILQSDPPQRM